jgi:hypothetical protein
MSFSRKSLKGVGYLLYNYIDNTISNAAAATKIAAEEYIRETAIRYEIKTNQQERNKKKLQAKRVLGDVLLGRVFGLFAIVSCKFLLGSCPFRVSLMKLVERLETNNLI